MLSRRNTAADLQTNAVVCQRCKRFQVDLTAASDNLNATDEELKASRQVISLLQRQLELFQVEKEGLEKLIVSQSKCTTTTSEPKNKIEDNLSNFDGLNLSEDTFRNIERCSPDEIQRKLLTLIKTQLYAKDEEIVKLKSSLKEAQNEKEQAYIQLHMLEGDLSQIKSENSLLKENLSLRDQTIGSLSAEVFEQSKPSESSAQRRQSKADYFVNHFELKGLQQQINKLTETLAGYKKTNKLLGSNVIELTEKCSQVERKEVEARSQCQELEAKCCQIQSKLLSLLKEIEQSSKQVSVSHQDKEETIEEEVIQSESVKLLIKRLLEDKSLDIPLSWKEGNRSKMKGEKNEIPKSTECDELGFYIVQPSDCLAPNADDATSDSRATNSSANRIRVRNLRRGRSEVVGGKTAYLDTVGEEPEDHGRSAKVNSANLHSVDASKKDESGWRMRWDEFIVEFDSIDLSRSNDFKNLLRTGVPQDYRCKIWKALIDLKIGTERRKFGPDYYQSLLEPKSKAGGQPVGCITNPSSKQIELDLLRTLPNNKYFETIDSTGTIRLRRILTAFSGHKPLIGYCQGMNRLAAVALLVLPEEEAFWCLVAIVDKIMPTGYYNDLWLAQVDSNVVMDLVAIKMPQLNEHFRRNGIELSLFAWFLTIFVDGTPPALFLRLWDCFLYEGDKIMFRIALALLRRHEQQLLDINNSVSINNFIRSTVNTPMDMDQFFEIAFNWINPLPGRLLRSKREQHFNAMKSSFRNLSEPSSGRTNSTTPVDEPGYADKKARDKDVDTDSVHEDSSIISI